MEEISNKYNNNDDDNNRVQVLESDEPSTPPENNFIHMKRHLETSPLIQPASSTSNLEFDSTSTSASSWTNSSHPVVDKKPENLMTLAQSIQAQREQEDEVIHPSAISKISSV